MANSFFSDDVGAGAPRPAIGRMADLSAAERQVEDSLRARVEADPDGFLRRYLEKFGNLINTDNAAELFEEYAASPESRTALRRAAHKPAQWIADQAFYERLQDPSIREAVFTAGGTGAGKSTAAAGVQKEGRLIYDSALTNLEAAGRHVEASLAAGRRVAVQYVYRDSIEAFRAVLARAQAEGRGRTVPIGTHVHTHTKAAETVRGLYDRYRNDDRVQFEFFENTGVPGNDLIARNFA